MKENAAVDFLIDPADMEKLMRLPPIESYGEFSCFPVFSGKQKQEGYHMKSLDQNAFAKQNIFGLGAENTAYAQYFIGQSFLNPLTRPEDGIFWATSPLSRAAGITGTSTTHKRAAARSCLHGGRGLVSGRGKGRSA